MTTRCLTIRAESALVLIPVTKLARTKTPSEKRGRRVAIIDEALFTDVVKPEEIPVRAVEAVSFAGFYPEVLGDLADTKLATIDRHFTPAVDWKIVRLAGIDNFFDWAALVGS